MDSCTRDIIDKVHDLIEQDPAKSERWPDFPSAARNAMLQARTPHGHFGPQMRAPVTQIVNESVFYKMKGSMYILEQITARPELANQITTLSLCGVEYVSRNRSSFTKLHHMIHSNAGTYGQFPFCEYSKLLSKILAKLPNLKHIRYYPVPKWHTKGTWKTIAGQDTQEQKDYVWNPQYDDDYELTPGNLESFRTVLSAIAESRVVLESFCTPYLGNHAPWCALPAFNMHPDQMINFTRNLGHPLMALRTLRINVACAENPASEQSRLSEFLAYHVPHLDMLELALSRKKTSFAMAGFCLPSTRLPKLQELRFMTDMSSSLSEAAVLDMLKGFPRLRRLALGYINVDGFQGSWDSLLAKTGEICKLESVWLLNPVELRPVNDKVDVVPWTLDKPVRFKGIAEDVRVVHVEPSMETYLKAEVEKRALDLKGFSVFER